MPEKLPGQQTAGQGQSRQVRSRPSSPSGNENTAFGGKRIRRCSWMAIPGSMANEFVPRRLDVPGRRRLQKHSSTTFLSDASSASSNNAIGSRFSALSKRRLSIRDQKVPQGPRPQDSSRRFVPFYTLFIVPPQFFQYRSV
ncbi:hypothetical protein BJX61DRAFT_239198 [Aspergillus egyptiacus]|nr:hypothetical protein BJX61DRAFT_239198 [Aspergillus egyptiacus]